MTTKREKEIRDVLSDTYPILNNAVERYRDMARELLAEIDRLRGENKRWRDTVRDQDNELDDFRKKLAVAVEQIYELKERVAVAEKALDRFRCEKCGSLENVHCMTITRNT